MIELKISPDKLGELFKKGYDLNIIAFLLFIKQDLGTPNIAKFDTLWNTLIRKGLISDGKISSLGEDLLLFIEQPEGVKFEKKKLKDEEFDKWWEIYPKSDNFVYKGKTFTGSRGLRQKKEECKIKLNAILQEGKYKIDDLIRALEFEINQKAEKSIKENKNIMSYMQGSLTYLNQRTFENFIEVSKKSEVKQSFNGVDI